MAFSPHFKREVLTFGFGVFALWTNSSVATAQNAPFAPTPLTLAKVLEQVDAYYPKTLGADLERRIASSKRLEKQGAFDPSITFNSDFLQYNSTSSPGKRLTTTTTDIAVEFPTPLGIKFIAGGRFNYGTVKSPDSSTGESGEYFFAVKAPLLRGFGINEKVAAERQARIGISLADQTFALTRLEILLKTTNLYWKWLASARKLQIQKDLLTVAEARAKFVQDSITDGALPPADQVVADGEVKQRLVLLIGAERSLQQAAYDLGLYLFTVEGTPRATPTLDEVPDYRTTLSPLPDATIEEGRKLALERRPELKSLIFERDRTQVDLRLAQNDRKPALDIIFNPGADTGLGSVGTTMKAGIVLSIPLQTRNADGRILAARQKLQKITLDTQDGRNRLLTAVNDAANAVNTSYMRSLAATDAFSLAKRAEENERERYRNGDSTLFIVNQFERATAQTAATVIDIEAEYEQALAAFRASAMQPLAP